MSGDRKSRDGWVWMTIFAVWGASLGGQIAILFLFPLGRIGWLTSLGWALFGVSAILGWLPIFVMRSHGGIAKRRSYVHTTKLVTSGPFAIVRHPQYLAGDFIAVAVACLIQHWVTIVVGAIAIATNRVSMIKADRDLVAKFGEPYRDYMARVPRANFLLGLWRRLRRG
jgi:protein-S-isoprenylcysteine O-methyltransferase Ste14